MGSRGPLPKPDNQRVNRKPRPDLRVVTNSKAEQPALDEQAFEWPRRTREWWEMWGQSPLAHDFTESDWSELADTALLHAVVYTAEPGSSAFFKAMSQLRRRTSTFGATPADRARLRIQFAFAEVSERKFEDSKAAQPVPPKGARARRGPLNDGFSVHNLRVW